MSDVAVEPVDVRRVYRSGGRDTVALDGLSLEIPRGAVFGLLGPNGAGKTTTVRILSTLLSPTSGSASVLGYDVERQTAQIRQHIGFIFGGDRGLYGRLTGRENLRYFAALHHVGRREAGPRIEELLTAVGIADRADDLVEKYSRGMKQRLHIARGLINDPDVLFMDEPTIGLDPIGAQEIRQMIPRLAAQGKTVLLTTHYMFEADQLCDQIAMINKGRLVALGTPSEIKGRFSNIRIVEILVRQAMTDTSAVLALDGVRRVEVSTDGGLQKLAVHTAPDREMQQVVVAAIGSDAIESVLVREPTLEEAYLSILG